MGGFLGLLAAWAPGVRGGDRNRLALVLRIENRAALSRCLGPVAVAGVLAQIAARLAADFRLAPTLQSDNGGHLCALLSPRQCRHAVRQAARVRALCGAGFGLPVLPVAPVIAAVLVRGPAHVGPAALFDCGRRHLAGAAPDGAVPLIDWIAPVLAGRAAPAQPQPGRLAPPQPAAPQRPLDPAGVEVRFQPQLCCHTGAVTGFEASAHLRHPLRGLLNPADARPALTSSDRLALAGAVLAQGLGALRHWDRAGHDVGTVSLDLAQAELCQPRLAETLLWELDRQEVAPSRLVIALQQTAGTLEGAGPVAANLHRLTEAGCRLDLDGFGTGHASLQAIRRLRVRRVKIDSSFLLGCDHDPGQQRMILAILALADHLGLDTLACGADTGPEHAFAAQIGCSHVQGLAIAPPLPLERTDAFLTRRRAVAEDLPRLRRA
ncbi:EAL domain-containing protein [Paracoccus endophyticus]|uniref:EAL domain-containing protein n=1 Tax=Paracoccus endophyticus TaxID=2233774 RepID=UPI000DD826CC|nr:EAL domain-containing protein [Paracoccus endophyticus]